MFGNRTSPIFICDNKFYGLLYSVFFGQIDILHYVYCFNFAYSTNNKVVIKISNVLNSNITKVCRHH